MDRGRAGTELSAFGALTGSALGFFLTTTPFMSDLTSFLTALPTTRGLGADDEGAVRVGTAGAAASKAAVLAANCLT